MIDIEATQKEYKFTIVKDEKAGIDRILFDDGRQYKFQHPSFMDFHSMVFESDKNAQQAAFEYGLKNCIFSENGKSPKIDENYLNRPEKFNEAIGLWSPLIRGLLFRDC